MNGYQEWAVAPDHDHEQTTHVTLTNPRTGREALLAVFWAYLGHAVAAAGALLVVGKAADLPGWALAVIASAGAGATYAVAAWHRRRSQEWRS